MHIGGTITSALLEKRYEDAKTLKLQRAEAGYETPEALSDIVRPRLEELQTLLATCFEELATAEDIDNCEICGQFVDMIEKILHGSKL